MVGHDAKKTELPGNGTRRHGMCMGLAPGAGDPIHFFLPEPLESSDGLE